MHRHGGRAAAVIAGVLLPCLLATATHAATGARAVSGSQQAGTGTWSAVASTTSTAPYAAVPLSLTFTASGTSRQYFNVVNTGTLPLTGETITATTTRSAAVIEACSTTWNETTGTCPSGTVTLVTTTGAAAATYNAPLTGTGSKIRLRARITALIQRNSTITIGVSVSRDLARKPAATTS